MDFLVLKGLFEENKGQLCVGETVLEDVFQTWAGRTALILVNYDPPMPLDRNLWGCGCCHWQPDGDCPAGHKEHPERMLLFTTQGLVTYEECVFRVDGTEVPLELLPGHDAQMLLLEVEDMTPNDSIQTLTEKLTETLEALSKMRP